MKHPGKKFGSEKEIFSDFLSFEGKEELKRAYRKFYKTISRKDQRELKKLLY